jgi:hypothetical protein
MNSKNNHLIMQAQYAIELKTENKIGALTTLYFLEEIFLISHYIFDHLLCSNVSHF